MEKILEIKKLKKYYGNTRGVEDVSLTLNKGDIYGFIGPNGAGKSTTIRTIMGLINKTSGNIFIKGKELDKDDIETKKIIGYLPSEINLYDDMTVKELFDYHESFYDFDISKKRKELVKTLKIDESKKIESLSLGNLKKVGITLALMHNPEILILDEPTSGLDPLMQQVFINFIVEEKKRGKTILLSSHIFAEVEATCDMISIIKDGKHVSSFNAEEVKKIDTKVYILRFKDKDNMDKYIEKCPFDIIEKVPERLSLTIKFLTKDYQRFIDSIIGIKLYTFAERPYTLQDYFMSFYKEDKTFGGLSGVVGNKK